MRGEASIAGAVSSSSTTISSDTSVAAKESTPISARLAATDYGYVIGELKRIFITAAIIVILLVVIAVLRH